MCVCVCVLRARVSVCIPYVCLCVCVACAGECVYCMRVFESLPAKEDGRECVHCTLSQSLIGTCLCMIYYTEYYQAELHST